MFSYLISFYFLSKKHALPEGNPHYLIAFIKIKTSKEINSMFKEKI
jgi:hypothetical protein